MENKLEKEFGKRIIADSKSKTLSLFDEGKLIQVFSDVAFGKNGVSKDKKEGDMCTPVGIFPIGFAFGTKPLNTEYPYYLINESVYWVSDSDSKYYNEWVLVTDAKKEFSYPYMHTSSKATWQDAEHLSDYPVQYELAFVIEYNKTCEKGKGSAIFLHVKNKEYTAGCIATAKENLEYVLKWLGSSQATIEIK